MIDTQECRIYELYMQIAVQKNSAKLDLVESGAQSIDRVLGRRAIGNHRPSVRDCRAHCKVAKVVRTRDRNATVTAGISVNRHQAVVKISNRANGALGEHTA